MRYFSTKDIIVIAMFGALGVVVGFLGNILHGMSSTIPFIGPAILHTVPQGIVLFACVCTVKKTGSAILQCLIAALISMPLMGAPLFILSYGVQGIALDAAHFILKNRIYSNLWISINGAIYAAIGVIMLFYVVLPLQGMIMPSYVVLLSLPVNMILGIIAALIGFRIGSRAENVIKG
jgi:hypothetical protein